jgi:hypothetical protein
MQQQHGTHNKVLIPGEKKRRKYIRKESENGKRNS